MPSGRSGSGSAGTGSGRSPWAVAMARAWEKVNTRSPRPRASTPRPRSNSTWSLFKKAIGPCDEAGVHKGARGGSQIRETKTDVILGRLGARTGTPVPRGVGTDALEAGQEGLGILELVLADGHDPDLCRREPDGQHRRRSRFPCRGRFLEEGVEDPLHRAAWREMEDQ